MIRLLPVVLIGGPSHPDKSILFDGLTKALRERHVVHHALRIGSVNEETWLPPNEQTRIRLLSIDAICEDELVERTSWELSQCLLPLLIDTSVDHQRLQACILQHCTHLLLLPHSHDRASQNIWFQLGERYGLLPLIDTYPSFESTISAVQKSMITGTFLSPERSFVERETLFDCLIERVTSLFSTYSHEELAKIHVRQAPGELVLHLSTLLQTLAPGAESWEPCMLPAVLEYIPARTPLSVYGQGPQWLYAALAAYANVDDFYQFGSCFLPEDVSSGWVASPPLLLSTTTRSKVHITYTRGDEDGRLTVEMSNTLDYLQASSLPFPPIPSHLGLILTGSMPTWLLTAVVRLYVRVGVPWIAYRQAQHCRDVVIFSQTTRHFVGESISIL